MSSNDSGYLYSDYKKSVSVIFWERLGVELELPEDEGREEGENVPQILS